MKWADNRLSLSRQRFSKGAFWSLQPDNAVSWDFVPPDQDPVPPAVLGDWREEILVLAGSELSVYRNPAPNPRPDERRLWEDRNYRRLKQCHNYYSP